MDDDISAIQSPGKEVSVWSHDESSFTVVAVGDGNWIRFMPLEKNEDDDGQEDAELVDKVDASQPSPFVWMTDHGMDHSYIKAATCATIYATGDHVGTLIIWRPRSTSQRIPWWSTRKISSQALLGFLGQASRVSRRLLYKCGRWPIYWRQLWKCGVRQGRLQEQNHRERVEDATIHP